MARNAQRWQFPLLRNHTDEYCGWQATVIPPGGSYPGDQKPRGYGYYQRQVVRRTLLPDHPGNQCPGTLLYLTGLERKYGKIYQKSDRGHFKDGKAYFGMPVFEGDSERPNAKRIIFEYTRQASMLLNFDQNTASIVFDHLAPPAPGLKGRYDMYGPDMSYDAYKLVNGRWKFQEDLPLKNPPTEMDEQYNDPRKMKTTGPTRKL
jgi:hypothetical protein